MEKKNIVLLCGGGFSEHDISLVSAAFLKDQLSSLNTYNLFFVEITKEGQWIHEETGPCEIGLNGKLRLLKENKEVPVDYTIPCLHGPPGENGDIQSFFELANISYLGAGPEASQNCFNKISTKLWFNAHSIPNTPFVFLKDSSKEQIKSAQDAFDQWGSLYVKASSQGSSIGCYFVKDKKDLVAKVKEAFKLSPYVLLEKPIVGRELEISVYEWEGKLIATDPAEIETPSSSFYSFEEKYSQDSKTETHIKARNIDDEIKKKMKETALKAFTLLKIKDLARVDFFLSKDREIYINEINTFPGMTPISLFPKMMEANGHSFSKFLKQKIDGR